MACHISKMLPSESNPGPPKVNGEDMQACFLAKASSRICPPYKTYEWYLEALKKMAEDQQQSEGDGNGEPGEGGPFGGADSSTTTIEFGEVDGTTQEIAKRANEGSYQEGRRGRRSLVTGDLSPHVCVRTLWTA